jgi:two-component system sensor histidine kinase MprB
MTLRARLTLAGTVVVAVSLVLASVLVYLFMRSDLRGQVDDGLRSRGEFFQARPFELHHFTDDQFFRGLPQPGFGTSRDYVQLVSDTGEAARPADEAQAVPFGGRELAVAAGKERPFFTDARVDGVHARVLTVPLANGVALQLARPLNEVDRELHRLGVILLVVLIGGVGLAAAGGAFVSRATLAPVRRVTVAAERVAQTRDASERVTATGRGELSRLAGAFNTALAALEGSIETQKRFVADASHELRTPLTSLQTNIEVLARAPDLEPAKRERLLRDLVRETQEMKRIVEGLLELARSGRGDLEHRPVRLDELVLDTIERVAPRHDAVTFASSLAETTVDGDPVRLERAVSNLLENAAKWSPPGGAVDVTLADGVLRVRDRGPGVAEEDRAHVFERFYRAADARSLPGAGLGLAIVKEVADAHGGRVAVEDVDGAGACFALTLPTVNGPAHVASPSDVPQPAGTGTPAAAR